MRFNELSPATLERIRTYRYDRIIEKHEGPEEWTSILKWYDPEFLEITGHQVLLPVGRDQHVNITILSCIPSADGKYLTIFLKDTTYSGDDPKWEMFSAGFLAICEKLPEEQFFLAIVYHEWFIVENPGPKAQ